MPKSNPRCFLTPLFGLALFSFGCYSATPSREKQADASHLGDGSDGLRSPDANPDGILATDAAKDSIRNLDGQIDGFLLPDATPQMPDTGPAVSADTLLADAVPDSPSRPEDASADAVLLAADAVQRDTATSLSPDLAPNQPQTSPDTGPSCGGCCAHSDCPTCQSCSAAHTCVAVVNAEDPAGRCAGICDATSTCKSKKGQACQKVAAGCASGTTCAPDGICCDQECSSPCMACDIAGFEGTCTPVASGNPHGNRTSCGTDPGCAGTCAGRNDGQCSFPSKPCGTAASCSGTDKVVPQSTCVNGTCQAVTTVNCINGFACAAGACNTTCTTSVDCQADYFCSGGTCHSDVVSVGTGTYHTCAGLKDGRVVCWGTGPHVIGDNITHTDSVTEPIQVYGLTDAKLVRAGQRQTCALRDSGGVSCWGMGQYGQLGTGMPVGGLSSYFSDAPVSVVKSEGGQLTGATDLSAGQDAFCAIGSSGPYCWGANSGGDLGYDSSTYGENVVAATLLSSCTGDKLVVMGGLFLAGLGTAGSTGAIDLWGYNSGGIVKSPGDYLTYPSCQNQTVFLSTYVSSMAAGLSHICVLLNSGAVQCWGANDSGQLGNGATSSAPDVVPGHKIPDFTATKLTAGSTFTCALTSAQGTVTCWGSNMAQVISADNSVATYPNPTSMTLNLPAGLTVADIASAPIAGHVCAIISDGSLMCWGSNYYRQTGVDTTATFVRPALVKVNW